jgi:hypothetical protein
MIYNEQDYLNALTKVNAINYNEEKWLIDNFELFKSTLNWPEGLPPINRTNLMEGTYRKEFNSFYSNLLNEYNHDLKNQKLIFQNRKPNNFD